MTELSKALMTVGACLLVSLAVIGCTTGAASTAPAEPAPAAEAPPEPEEYKNTLRWSTASEVDNFGFDIYRGTSEDGPFERITEGPIPGAGTTDEPQSYVYVDDTIDPTQGYFYYIESISVDSVRERFSPVISIGPKKPAEE